MPAALPMHISPGQLALVLGISERAVRMRAKNGRWPYIFTRVQGGRSHNYLTAGLPDEVRAKITDKIRPAASGPAAAAGRARAVQIRLQEQEAADIARQTAEAGLAAFSRLPEAQQRQAKAREQILKARDAFITAAGLSKKRGSKLFVAEFCAGTLGLPRWVVDGASCRKGALSWATLLRWEKAFSENGLAGLADNYQPGRKSAIADHMAEFIQAMVVQHPHTSASHIHQGLCARFDGQVIPSAATIRRYVAAWKKRHTSLFLYLSNPDAWKSRHLVAFGRSDEQVTRLNKLWELDSTPGDVMLTDGRHTLIGVIDVYSRRAKIHVSPTSKSAAIAALVRRALLDWGVPEIAKTDNGADYVSEHLVRVFESLGIHQHLCTEFCPEEKPHIERFFGTCARDLVELLPGYIGHSVAERKAIEARRSFAQRLMSYGSDPVRIDLTAAQLQDILNRWCAAVYHHNPHSSLEGLTPARVARAWTTPVRKISDPRALDILLCPAPDNHGMRVIGKKGIKIEHGWFVAPELAPLIGEQVFVLLDATDYGTVHVFTIEEDGSRAYLCTAVNPERTGHDRKAIAATAKAAQKQFMAEAGKHLRKAARKVAVDAIGQEILAYREAQIAKITDFPRRGAEHTTCDLQQAALVVEQMQSNALSRQPIPISCEEKQAAARLIDMAEARTCRPLPATDQEKYEQLCEDLSCGIDLSDAELAWMKRHELWLETGERAAF